jgi:hypothetical protein
MMKRPKLAAPMPNKLVKLMPGAPAGKTAASPEKKPEKASPKKGPARAR